MSTSGGYRTLVVAGSALVAASAIQLARSLLAATLEPSAMLEILSTPWLGGLPALLIFAATIVLTVGVRPERGVAKSMATRFTLVAYGATWLLGLILGLAVPEVGISWVWAGSILDLARVVLGFVAGVLVAREAVLSGVARWSLLVVAAAHVPGQLSSLVVFPPWAPQPMMWEQLNLIAVLFWGATYVVDGLPKRGRAEAGR